MLQNISGYLFCLFSFFFARTIYKAIYKNEPSIQNTHCGKRLFWQVFWALQLVTVLVPGAVFHLYAAYKNIAQEDILERPTYTVFYIISVLLRIVLEVAAFWLQSRLFGFLVHSLYFCDSSSLDKTLNLTKCMVPEHFEKTIFLSAMYIFTIITMILCMAEVFEILCRRLGYLTHQRQSPA